MPRSRRCRWHCAKSYRLSAWSLLGRHRGRPVSPGTLGMASTSTSNTTEPWRLAPVTLGAKGTPRRSTARWRLLSSLPRSVGFGPVCLLAPGARYRRAVDARPPPVDLVMLAQTLEQRQMQSLPNTVSLPVAQAAPACHTAAKAQFLW